MPKIVQLSSVHPSFDTRIFYKICSSLVKAGYTVDLMIQHPKEEVINGIKIIPLPESKRKADRIYKIIPSIFKKCFQYPKGTIFHLHDPELIPMGFILKGQGYKVIYDVHEDVPKDILAKEWIPKYLRKILAGILNLLEQGVKRYFDHIIVVTEAIERRLKSSKTTVIQNFPILDKLSKNTSEGYGKNNVFYIGDITRVRGVKEIVKAIELVNYNFDIRLILAGKFSPVELQNELTEVAGWNYTDFVGWVKKEEFNKYASRAIAGLVTFHPIPNHIEAQPNKLFEYMLAGIPVIASDFPLWREIIEGNNCGVLVDPLNPKDIADAIIYLYKNPQEAKEMGENGRRAVIEKYNWEQEEVKLLKIYSELLKEN